MENSFGKISIIGAGNVAFTLCRILKDKGLIPYCVFVRDASKIDDVRSELEVIADAVQIAFCLQFTLSVCCIWLRSIMF